MIIVDRALKARAEEGKPIRVGMIGAGFMAQGLTNQIENSVPGMRMAAIYNRRPERALGVYRYAGHEHVVSAGTQSAIDEAIRRGAPVVAEDPFTICRSPEIDVVVDVTGSVEFGARIILESFQHEKPVVLMMNLVRWVKGLGLLPRVVGNVKGLQDPYRNPTTQKGWAERWGQNAAMVTSFADGSKISFEQSIVANATGFKVRSRGMSRGRKYDGSIMEIQKLYDVEELRALGGIVDYTVGPPLIKVFVLAEHPDPKQRHYLSLYKMGEGPLYPFWIPYHLVHFETPFSIARVVLFGDELAPPLGGPMVEVCAVAKRNLEAGEVLDEYGMYMTYGEAVNSDEMSSNRYLPEGLVEGCKLRRNVGKDQVLTYDDVELPEGRIADRLRAEQYRRFRGETWLEEHLSARRTAERHAGVEHRA
ncbi:MAG: NAD(P)-dependent oxidoreductase [Deltaproteobacteria bacterium]|nr:MAG: NAD(P)-dependent oxidoreductase [Deltaproteobacteria bacterium]